MRTISGSNPSPWSWLCIGRGHGQRNGEFEGTAIISRCVDMCLGPLLLQHIMSGESYSMESSENPVGIRDDDLTSTVRRARSRGVGLLLVKRMLLVPMLFWTYKQEQSVTFVMALHWERTWAKQWGVRGYCYYF